MVKQYLRVLALCAACSAAIVSAVAPATAVVYHGAPDFQLTSDLIAAGSGRRGFDAKLLFKTLYGPKAPEEAARLIADHGQSGVDAFFELMDHSMAFVLAAAKGDHLALPAPTPNGSPSALAARLRAAGTGTTGHFDVGYLIERLISHPYHHLLMLDLAKTYPANRVSDFHQVLGEAIADSAHP